MAFCCLSTVVIVRAAAVSTSCISTCSSRYRSISNKMVRYIKDGAYTIVVDDAPSTASGPRDDVGSSRRSSKSGSRSAGAQSRNAERLKAIQEAQEHDELMSHASTEEVDYTSVNFILQNLSIAVPRYEADKSGILFSRRDMAEMIAHQVCFYVYCTLQVFINRADMPLILFFGDGFIGTRVIQALTDSGCQSFLRIYCRGDIAADEWKRRGYLADSSITRLLGDAKPSIIILSADYYSFHHIFHLLTQEHLTQPDTCIISTTLGFQRRKLLSNFGTPTIFRAFVEPEEIVRSYRTKRLNKLTKLNTNVGETSLAGSNEGLTAPSLESPTGKSRSLSQGSLDSLHQPGSPVLEDDNVSLADSIEESSEINLVAEPNVAEKAATVLACRSLDLTNVLMIIENFYSLHNKAPDEARHMALKALVGYVDSRFKETSGPAVKRDRKEARRARHVIQLVDNAVLQLFSQSAVYFQKEFSRRLPVVDLNKLTNEYRRNLSLAIPTTPDAPVSSGGKGHHNHHPSLLKDIHTKAAAAQQVTPSKSEVKILEPDDKEKKYQAMYEMTRLFSIYLLDEDYSKYDGPGFKYMEKLDAGDKRKATFQGASTTGLKIFLSPGMTQTETNVENPSTPMHFRRDHMAAKVNVQKSTEGKKF
ncbi:hypothetical protein EON65_02285 [archaeon]|nr:MAG: hypothetical protein EON65_02285 [archaeon]